jgi:hypothetical protein
MTVDASRSCLSLVTGVGSAIRQIVDARVLLTATVPPALPGKRVSNGSLAPPLDVIPGFRRSTRYDCHLASDGPDKARQFASERRGDDIGRFARSGEPAKARAQSDLPFPGDVANWLGLVLLSEQQLAAKPGWETVAPGRLDQQPASRVLPASVMPPRLTLRPLECSDGSNPR